jgi:hypothetical protein
MNGVNDLYITTASQLQQRLANIFHWRAKVFAPMCCYENQATRNERRIFARFSFLIT